MILSFLEILHKAVMVISLIIHLSLLSLVLYGLCVLIYEKVRRYI